MEKDVFQGSCYIKHLILIICSISLILCLVITNRDVSISRISIVQNEYQGSVREQGGGGRGGGGTFSFTDKDDDGFDLPMEESPTVDEIVQSLSQSLPPKPDIVLEYLRKQPYSFPYMPPLPFVRSTQNPCWQEKHKLRCLPQFYLAGFPKCGTTDLWARMELLPGVVNTSMKEPHWWTRYRYPVSEEAAAKGARGGNMDYYTDLFKSFDINIRGQIIGDGSQSTLWDDYFLQTRASHDKFGVKNPSRRLRYVLADYRLHPLHLIKAYTPQAKFILLVRDPTERLYSDYLFFSGLQYHSMTKYNNVSVSQEMFHQKFLEGRRELIQCFRRHGIRRCAFDVDLRKKSTIRKMRIEIGLYVLHLHSLLQTFPRDQVLVINTRDYAQSRRDVMKGIAGFLQLPVTSEILDRIDLLPRALTRREDRKIGPMWDSTRRIVNDFYAPFNALLADLMQDPSFKFNS